MRATIDYGIDLGTSNSAIAVQERAKPRLLPGQGDDSGVLLPSVVHVRADGSAVVGAAAAAMRSADPENTALEFKRQMGTAETLPFSASGKSMSPVELSALILTELARRAKAHSGEPLRAAVITVPAMFQLAQCEATRQAAASAGIEHAPLLQEPIAAAIAHSGAGFGKDGHWLVYDLGGGTFDASLVRSKAGRLQVLDHDGDNHLGGKDFNRVLARWAADHVRREGRLGEFRRTDPALASAFARLAAEAERVRVSLSEREQERFVVPQLATAPGGEPVGIDLPIDRGLLESLISPFVQRTTELCKAVLSRNRLTSAELKGIVLVGGPTRTPCLPVILERELGLPAKHAMDPTTIVAAGAAVFAATQKLPPALRAARAAGQGDVLNLELEYESMTTNPRPLLVGRAATTGGGALAGGSAGGNAGTTAGLLVGIRRDDGKFEAGPIPFGANGAFAVPLALRPGELNSFQLSVTRGRDPVPVSPTDFAILHGLSVAKPPLSQSVGVMLADNSVRWYLRKGAVLPARNTVTHTTTVPLIRGQSADPVKVPLVQGEGERADRNKVIGVLHIHADRITRDLPAGSEVQVTLTVDEFSRTTARGYVPLLDQWFDEIVMFQIESKTADQVTRGLGAQKDRLKALEEQAAALDAGGGGNIDGRIQEVEQLIAEGDRDSVDSADQLLRRMIQQIDQVETGSRADKLRTEFAEVLSDGRALAENDEQRREVESLAAEFQAAMDCADVPTAEVKLNALLQLVRRAMYRRPEFWQQMLAWLFQQFQRLNMSGITEAQFKDGAKAAERGEEGMPDLVRICIDLFNLLPKEDRQQVGAFSEAISSTVV